LLSVRTLVPEVSHAKLSCKATTTSFKLRSSSALCGLIFFEKKKEKSVGPWYSARQSIENRHLQDLTVSVVEMIFEGLSSIFNQPLNLQPIGWL